MKRFLILFILLLVACNSASTTEYISKVKPIKKTIPIIAPTIASTETPLPIIGECTPREVSAYLKKTLAIGEDHIDYLDTTISHILKNTTPISILTDMENIADAFDRIIPVPSCMQKYHEIMKEAYKLYTRAAQMIIIGNVEEVISLGEEGKALVIEATTEIESVVNQMIEDYND